MHGMKMHSLAVCLALGRVASSVQAEVIMDGSFTASKSCPAFQSIRKQTNPGNATVVAGQSYDVKAKNNVSATHYRIEVPGAQPPERWVAVDCGRVGSVTAGKPQQTPGPFYVLALSWEPAFCESLPDKQECKTQTATRADARQFSLHGLWPQPRRNVFCGVDKTLIEADDQHRWTDLPEPQMPPETKSALAGVMPGTQSLLERHEWIKHGTCYPATSAEQYFNDATRLTAAVNQSAVGEFIAANVGREIKSSELRATFDAAFFSGAGDRVRVACKPDGGRQLVTEITIGLKGDIPGGSALAELMGASTPTDPGCPGGILDPVGLQ
jgi:ribonuclease T2